jgi:hypothetical protein
MNVMSFLSGNAKSTFARGCDAVRLCARGVALLMCGLFISSTCASDLSHISVYALGPLDGRAVFQYPDGKMAILKLGASVEGTDARLVQVLNDRAVLEDVQHETGQQPIRELVWLYKADANGHSQMKRFSLRAPPQPVVGTPIR